MSKVSWLIASFVLGAGALLLALGPGCKRAQSADARAAPASPIVASYGGKKVRLADVDALVAQQLYSLRAQALQELIVSDLLNGEANKRKTTVSDLMKREVEEKAGDISETEMQSLYAKAEAAGELEPGADFQRFKQQIRDTRARHSRMDRYEEFLDQLMQTSGTEIDVAALGQPAFGVALDGPSRGPASAPVTMVEYVDYESPHCADAQATVERLLSEYAGKLRLVVKQSPQKPESRARRAAEAALCAHDHGKFFEYQALLYANQKRLEDGQLLEYARSASIDHDAFDACLRSGKHAATVDGHLREVKQHELEGSPAFVVNGVFLSGAHSYRTFKRLIDHEIKGRPRLN
jgi:predicted DsbA family dithiol-disulfide isomerase